MGRENRCCLPLAFEWYFSMKKKLFFKLLKLTSYIFQFKYHALNTKEKKKKTSSCSNTPLCHAMENFISINNRALLHCCEWKISPTKCLHHRSRAQVLTLCYKRTMEKYKLLNKSESEQRMVDKNLFNNTFFTFFPLNIPFYKIVYVMCEEAVCNKKGVWIFKLL